MPHRTYIRKEKEERKKHEKQKHISRILSQIRKKPLGTPVIFNENHSHAITLREAGSGFKMGVLQV